MTASSLLRNLHPIAVYFALSVLILSGCGSGQPVRVLPEGSTAIIASLGGPIQPSRSPIGFVPYLTAGIEHGITDDVTVHGNLHLLMAFFAVGGIDIGASGRLWRQNDALPEVTASARLIGFMKFGDPVSPRLYPDVSLNASWEVADRTLAYIGTHTTFQWKPGEVFISPFVGVQFPLSSRFSLQTELIWQAANHDTRVGLFEGLSSIGGMGSFGGFVAGVFTL
ncbi:MAG: hypothetical protein H7X70_02905 [Candidatus Kapabacteria bacterium]|nr:hypothetical protein [Candidatus Kapabacteria bacterium]